MVSPTKPWVAVVCAFAFAGSGARALALGAADAGEELRCVFEVTRETVTTPLVGGGDPARAVRPRALPREKESFHLIVGLTRNTFVCEDPDTPPEVVTYLFPTRRIIELDLKQKTFRDLSLHAIVAFRVNESINRFAFAATFAKTKANPADPDPAPPDPNLIRCIDRFAVETLFSIRLKSAPPAPPGAVFLAEPVIKRESGPAGKGWRFLHDNDLAVEFVPSDRPVPPVFRRSLRHFLAYRCAIHPEIREQIIASGFLPQRLSYRSFEFFGRTDQTITLRLASATIGPPARPEGLPPGFVPLVDPNDALDLVFRKLREAPQPAPTGAAIAAADCKSGPGANVVAQQAAKAKPDALPADRPALLHLVEEALKQGHIVDAHLAWCEYSARTGDPAPEVGAHIGEVARPLHVTLVSPFPAPTAEGAVRQLRELDAIDRKGLTRGYMIDAIAGTILAALSRPAEAEARWLKALEANPRLAGVYIQLGTSRFRTFGMTDAWRCFDAARRVDPHSPHLADIAHLESRFETDFPDEF